MILRAWHNWLGVVNSNRTHRRRSLNAFPVECLESRVLLATTTTPKVSGSSSSPCLTLYGSATVTIGVNSSTQLPTYDIGSGAVDFGTLTIDMLSKITISDSSSSNNITINLSTADGLSSSFKLTVNGNSGNDVIDASGCDFPVSLNGGAGTDELMGGSANDTLSGSTGNDVLTGGEGDDDLYGGSGNDELSGDDGDDLCLGDTGDDNISGGLGNDNVNGQSGNDQLYGDDGNDYIFGGAGRDYIDGGGDIDVVKGQGGFDTITGGYDEARDESIAFKSLGSDTWRDNLGNAGSPNLDPRDTRSEFENG